MKSLTLLAATAAAAASPPAQVAAPPELSPAEIAASAPAPDWIRIAPADLLVMDLAPTREGAPRRVVMQLLPAPFAQGWIANIRKLAAARWWDGLSINRVQDNYVVQWGDANAEDKAKGRKLPRGLRPPPAAGYVRSLNPSVAVIDACKNRSAVPSHVVFCDSYAPSAFLRGGWALASDGAREWPVHCYGAVGVGRDMPPDTGSGAELYAVIGQAPRHLDRNIAVIGRVIDGMELLSSLPRGSGPLGFYEAAEERVGIVAIRSGTAVKDLPPYEFLSTESASFSRYADARANRRDAFFIQPAGAADICNVPVPVRRVK